MSQSKVCPVLVRNSFNFDSALISSTCKKPQHYNFPTNYGFLNGLVKSKGCCKPSVSDIFCVTGAITAIIGSLIASFGIFPKNQARIRIYLECIGSAMLIFGILVVMLSIKMRSKIIDRLDNWVSFDSSSQTNNIRATYPLADLQQTIPLNRRRNYHSIKLREYKRSKHADSLTLYNNSIHESQLNNNDRHHQQQDNTIALGRAELVAAAGEAATRNVAGESIKYDSINNDNSINSSERTSKLKKMILFSRSINVAEETDSNTWTPDKEEGYGIDHQPAIETALSIVLTVSTLVSFRADKSKPNHCCLHHAVQHKLKAQKWVKKMKISVQPGEKEQLSQKINDITMNLTENLAETSNAIKGSDTFETITSMNDNNSNECADGNNRTRELTK